MTVDGLMEVTDLLMFPKTENFLMAVHPKLLMRKARHRLDPERGGDEEDPKVETKLLSMTIWAGDGDHEEAKH